MRRVPIVVLVAWACDDDPVVYGPPCEVPPRVELIPGEGMDVVDGRIHLVADFYVWEHLFAVRAGTDDFQQTITGLGDSPYAYAEDFAVAGTDVVPMNARVVGTGDMAFDLPLLFVELPPCDYDAATCTCTRTCYIIMLPDVAMEILDVGPQLADLRFTETGWPCILDDGSIGAYGCPVTVDVSIPILFEVIKAQ